MNRPLIEEIEARILFSAVALGLVLDAPTLGGPVELRFTEEDALTVSGTEFGESRHQEIVFVDDALPDYESLVESILRDAQAGRSIEIVVLRGNEDGIQQISEALAGRHGIGAVHLNTHGADGRVQLGGSALDATSLQRNASAVSEWGRALDPDADLLIYGCDVARTDAGKVLMSNLAQLTGADVAASEDPTGSDALGGDWVLEYRHGEIQASILVPSTGTQWQGLLANLTVDTTNDVVDGNTSSIALLLANRGSDGFISLREAIIATNNTTGADTISLAGGTYTLSVAGAGEDAAASGDLDILGGLTITGAGSGTTIVDGAGLDRVFEAHVSNAIVIQDIMVRNGDATNKDGGGLLVNAGGNVQLERVVLNGNTAKTGGAIANDRATLAIVDSTIDGNSSTNSGGGLSNTGGFVTMTGSTVSGNSSGSVGGGIENKNSGASLTLTNVTMSGNTASTEGGAIFNQSLLSVTNSTIAFNSAGTVVGGISTYFPGGLLRNTILASNTNGNFSGTLISLGYNIDSDGTAALSGTGDLSGVNPLLDATLQANGGYTATHALQAGSPAIDAGTNTATPPSDQRGFARVGATDIGAYEFAGAVLVTPPTDIALSNTTVAENTSTAGGYSVGTLTATDPDAGDTFIYSIAGGTDAASFSIAGAQSDELILDAGLLDYEVKASYVVRVAVTDSAGNRYEETFTIDAGNINDAPVNALPSSAATNAGTPLVFSAANGNNISVQDPDAGSASMQVTLTAANGTLTLATTTGLIFSTGDGSADALMSFTGSSPNINAALDGISFNPAAGFLGAASLTIAVDDQGNTGAGVARSDSDSITITVSPPTLLYPSFFPPTNLERAASGTPAVANSAISETPPEAQAAPKADGYEIAGRSALPLYSSEVIQITESSDRLLLALDLEDSRKVLTHLQRAGFNTNTSSGTSAWIKPPGFLTGADSQSLILQGLASLSAPSNFSVEALRSSLSSSQWLGELRHLQEQLEEDIKLNNVMIGATAFVSGGLSAGYVIWLLRGGLLLSTFLSSLPAWHSIDPLPVLGRKGVDDKDEDETDPIERMFGKIKAALRKPAQSPASRDRRWPGRGGASHTP